MKKNLLSIVILIAALGFYGCSGNTSNNGREPQELSGAGATFPLPFYNVIFVHVT